MIGAIFLAQDSEDVSIAFVDRARWEQLITLPTATTPEEIVAWDEIAGWLALDEEGQSECAEWAKRIGAPSPRGNVIATWHCQRGVFTHGSINMTEVAGMVVT